MCVMMKIHIFMYFIMGLPAPNSRIGAGFLLFRVGARGVRTGYKNLYPYLRIILLNFHGAGLPPANS